MQGAKQPLLDFLRSRNPESIAVNYSQDSEVCDGLTHGMYLTLQRVARGDRLRETAWSRPSA